MLEFMLVPHSWVMLLILYPLFPEFKFLVFISCMPFQESLNVNVASSNYVNSLQPLNLKYAEYSPVR